MRIAAIYDIHGNLPALEEVLAQIRIEQVDRIVMGGDVLPGPMPRESLELLQSLDIPISFIKGNCESDALAELTAAGSSRVPEKFRELVRWSANQLDEAAVKSIAGWPATVEFQIEGLGHTLFCHATPSSDVEIFLRTTADAKLTRIFERLTVDCVVCGHTHMQFDRQLGKTRILNAGSVGMPYQDPGAYWLLLGPNVQFQQTAYDAQAAASRVLLSEYPQAREFAEQYILSTPSREKMETLFSSMELK